MMTGFTLFVPAVLEHVLIAVSNTVMPVTAAVQNAGRHVNESRKILEGYFLRKVVSIEPDHLAVTLKGKQRRYHVMLNLFQHLILRP